FFFFQAEDGIRDKLVTGVQTCALPISAARGQREIEERAPFLRFIPFLYLSAKTGQRVPKLLELILEVADERAKRVPTSEVNRVRSEERRVGKECRARGGRGDGDTTEVE